MARRRLRNCLVQIWLSRDELERLRAIVQQEGSTRADVVRAWIGQHPLHGPIFDNNAPPDPRQLHLYEPGTTAR